MSGAAAARSLRAVVVPEWLAEVVRPRRAPVPWPEMTRAALAICVPLSVSFAAGRGTLGVLPATGGLLGTMADAGGPYLSRVKRVCSAAVFGGAAGLTIGAVTHGHGWLAVVALVVVAGVSGLLSALGDIGSVTGLQLLVYTSLGAGPVGALRPVWHTAAGFLVGVLWALILILPGWLRAPYGREQRDVAAVYDALAGLLRSVGGDGFTAARQALTTALNTAYDELLTARSTATGLNRRRARLLGALNTSHLMAEAAVAVGLAGTRPPPLVIDVVSRLADAIRTGSPPPMIPPAWDESPAMLTLRDAMADAARALSRQWYRAWPAAGRAPAAGRVNWIFTLRLMACMGAAGVVSEVLPLQRSYWVPLTVAIVFKPDYGSVFARALQRGIGTVVGAVAGAVLLVLVHGTWLLIPFAVLAALLPFGRSRNYGLLATFLTPLVVVLIDLLNPGGWRLAEDRLIDTLIGCAIVLLIGFAPWPMSWYSHLPPLYARAALDVCRYMQEALGGSGVLVLVRRGGWPGWGRGAHPVAAAAVHLPGPGRPARRVPAHHVRAAVDQQARDRLVARGDRAGAGHGRDHRDRAGRQPRRAGTAVGRPAAVRRAGGGERGGGDGFGAGEGAGTAGRRDAQAGHRRGPGAARGARHRRAAHRVGPWSGWPWSSWPAGCGCSVVGLAGFEPATSATQTRRASQTALQPVPGRV